ncbi:rhodanese-like domain-containing protein [Candidatus Venteria ishoeyi]|uniref:Putative adenylyltransferase/sulfurtransferase MoeZ n=1 Tax=Candidatus Venteria ishoeyi TaxID=1899563 RepID=A0A1H6FCW7_9GAMM|nr:rhodanese-like domain-containing protein [Candidatus Venteria ishoeyi]MDM8545059.1 rhodanese-like domain-containing protein [Candidatus Venteria ishoeyi]SEH07918.1 putative adenylyltransferase/sulfurtransferase MoeZ [Candidatus Venteria ishoeyi]
MNIKQILVIVIMSLFAVTTVPAYDTELADSYAQLFQPFTGKASAKSMQMIKVPDFVKAIKSGKKLVVLDVRTPGERVIMGTNLPDTLNIPMGQVFKPENLQRLPDNKKIVVLCAKGSRASVIALTLRHIGFKQVFILKGGLAALAQYLNPKSAN